MTLKFTLPEFTLTIQSGKNRFGEKEGFDCIEIRPGDTISIVGPTGSGKSALINDIETLAQADDELPWNLLSTEEIHESIRQLPEGARVVCVLRLVEGYRHAEIAAMLSVSESTSKSQYRRGISILQHVLTKKISEKQI